MAEDTKIANAKKMAIQNCIRRLRFEHDEMTQAQLAQSVGVTRQTILALEANKYTPSLDLAFRIARLFNKNLEEVFTYEDGDLS